MVPSVIQTEVAVAGTAVQWQEVVRSGRTRVSLEGGNRGVCRRLRRPQDLRPEHLGQFPFTEDGEICTRSAFGDKSVQF